MYDYCECCGAILLNAELIAVPVKDATDGVLYYWSCKSQDCIDELAQRD